MRVWRLFTLDLAADNHLNIVVIRYLILSADEEAHS